MAQFKMQKFTFFAPRTVIFPEKTKLFQKNEENSHDQAEKCGKMVPLK